MHTIKLTRIETIVETTWVQLEGEYDKEKSPELAFQKAEKLCLYQFPPVTTNKEEFLELVPNEQFKKPERV